VVGERIRAIRQQRGLTQKELGQRLGLSEPTVSNHETATTQIGADFLVRYAEVLECHPCDFFDAAPGRPAAVPGARIPIPSGIVESYEVEGAERMLVDFDALQHAVPGMTAEEAAIVADLIASLRRHRANPSP